MRYFYSLLLYLLAPILILRLLWRSRKDPSYRKRIKERFGFYTHTLEESIWVHAVSVGEAVVATPIIEYLIQRYPQKKILITTTTPTGSEYIKKTFGEKVSHVYLPYDFPDAMGRFIGKMQPIIAIIIETEIWPNFIAACRRKKIPLCLLNARLSALSFQKYQKISRFIRSQLQSFALIAAVSDQDAARFIHLGAQDSVVKVTGNIKFDLIALKQTPSQPKNNVKERLESSRHVWVAASTHKGEEEIILAAHQKLLAQIPNVLLVLVPRHRDRFDEVFNLCQKRFPTIRHRDGLTGIAADIAVYVGDVMGELMEFYASCDVAFVGGSLIPHGGHNMIEPAALGKPILSGPHIYNFVAESEPFLQKNALIVVEDEDDLANQLTLLFKDEMKRSRISESCQNVVLANRGALQKQLQLLTKLISIDA